MPIRQVLGKPLFDCASVFEFLPVHRHGFEL